MISKRNNLQNRFYKSSVKTLTKKFLNDLEVFKTTEKKEELNLNLEKTLASIYSLIDKGLKKNVYHKNTAARKKAKLAALLKNACGLV